MSFDYIFIDEYQDCTLEQHEFILAIAAGVPKAIVFGDELQAIFGFAGPLATWSGHVLPRFPAHSTLIQPHRWAGHNDDLGAWLLDLRSQLVEGAIFDAAAHKLLGVQFVATSGPKTVSDVAHSFRTAKESVVLLDKWPNDVANHASRLGGEYLVMEDIGGNFMLEQLRSLPTEGDYRLATWLARFSKKCIIGLAGLDHPVLNRLDSNQEITHYRRNGLGKILVALDALRTEPTYKELTAAADVICQAKGMRLYRWEAWHDTCEAISRTAENGDPPTDNLFRVRDRLRRTSRGNAMRIASRTLLIKGLEYDHVIIADVSKFTDPRNLYVALSRARKTVTIIGKSSTIGLHSDK